MASWTKEPSFHHPTPPPKKSESSHKRTHSGQRKVNVSLDNNTNNSMTSSSLSISSVSSSIDPHPHSTTHFNQHQPSHLMPIAPSLLTSRAASTRGSNRFDFDCYEQANTNNNSTSSSTTSTSISNNINLSSTSPTSSNHNNINNMPHQKRFRGPPITPMNSFVNEFAALASPRNGSGSVGSNAKRNGGSFGRTPTGTSTHQHHQNHQQQQQHQQHHHHHQQQQQQQQRFPSVHGNNNNASTNDSNSRNVNVTTCNSSSQSRSTKPSSSSSFSNRRRSKSNKLALSLNMSIIEDDSRNGMVPPPAGDSTRSLQASCDAACSRVNDSMFVGGARIAKDQHVLLQSGITHVLNCAGVSCEDYFPNLFQYRTLMLRDTGREDITPYLFSALEFVHAALLSGGKIFIHCVKGISRSPAVAIAYMMWSSNVTLEQAHRRMKQVRPISDPNAGFIFQLREWCEIPPSLALKSGQTLVYRIAGPPEYKITDRAGDSVCSLAASIGPLFVLPPVLASVISGHSDNNGNSASNEGNSNGNGTNRNGSGTSSSSSDSSNTNTTSNLKVVVPSTASASSSSSNVLKTKTSNSNDLCYMVCCGNVTWLWHTQACSLRMLEMSRSVARQMQVVAGASNTFTRTMIDGNETSDFKTALKLVSGLDSLVNGNDSEEDTSDDQEMAGNPQEMSM